MLQPDVRSAARSVFVGCRNITLELIILLSSVVGPSDASGRADRISREIPSANQFPCYLDLIPLLFGCYSAVGSAVIPLSIPRSRVGNSSKYLNQRTFSRRFSQETAASAFFSR